MEFNEGKTGHLGDANGEQCLASSLGPRITTRRIRTSLLQIRRPRREPGTSAGMAGRFGHFGQGAADG